nr:MAG TPA: hypothetical protein [Caudoviricetes sp.]
MNKQKPLFLTVIKIFHYQSKQKTASKRPAVKCN